MLYVRLHGLLILVFFLSAFALGQNAKSNAVRTVSAQEDFECGLTDPPLLKFAVSVWDRRQKAYVRNLHYTDFEILEDGKVLPWIDYFTKPSDEAASAEVVQYYVLGVLVDDWKQNRWHKLKIGLKSPKPMKDLVIVAPAGYFY